jgi:hypothetical protein
VITPATGLTIAFLSYPILPAHSRSQILAFCSMKPTAPSPGSVATQPCSLRGRNSRPFSNVRWFRELVLAARTLTRPGFPNKTEDYGVFEPSHIASVGQVSIYVRQHTSIRTRSH